MVYDHKKHKYNDLNGGNILLKFNWHDKYFESQTMQNNKRYGQRLRQTYSNQIRQIHKVEGKIKYWRLDFLMDILQKYD